MQYMLFWGDATGVHRVDVTGDGTACTLFVAMCAHRPSYGVRLYALDESGFAGKCQSWPGARGLITSEDCGV